MVIATPQNPNAPREQHTSNIPSVYCRYKVNIQQTELGENRLHLSTGVQGEAKRDSHPRKGRNEDAVWDLLFVFRKEILQCAPARSECLR